jgi:tRNA U34 5-carboxymethylaminomethyl modifying enzyme MnmG/GidA
MSKSSTKPNTKPKIKNKAPKMPSFYVPPIQIFTEDLSHSDIEILIIELTNLLAKEKEGKIQQLSLSTNSVYDSRYNYGDVELIANYVIKKTEEEIDKELRTLQSNWTKAQEKKQTLAAKIEAKKVEKEKKLLAELKAKYEVDYDKAIKQANYQNDIANEEDKDAADYAKYSSK